MTEETKEILLTIVYFCGVFICIIGYCFIRFIDFWNRSGESDGQYKRIFLEPPDRISSEYHLFILMGMFAWPLIAVYAFIFLIGIGINKISVLFMNKLLMPILYKLREKYNPLDEEVKDEIPKV